VFGASYKGYCLHRPCGRPAGSIAYIRYCGASVVLVHGSALYRHTGAITAGAPLGCASFFAFIVPSGCLAVASWNHQQACFYNPWRITILTQLIFSSSFQMSNHRAPASNANFAYGRASGSYHYSTPDIGHQPGGHSLRSSFASNMDLGAPISHDSWATSHPMRIDSSIGSINETPCRWLKS
jgi:hypothetical protein